MRMKNVSDRTLRVPQIEEPVPPGAVIEIADGYAFKRVNVITGERMNSALEDLGFGDALKPEGEKAQLEFNAKTTADVKFRANSHPACMVVSGGASEVPAGVLELLAEGAKAATPADEAILLRRAVTGLGASFEELKAMFIAQQAELAAAKAKIAESEPKKSDEPKPPPKTFDEDVQDAAAAVDPPKKAKK